jgi:hypothetical protein
MADPDNADQLAQRVDALVRREHAARDADLPVLTEVVDDAALRRPAMQRAELEALARELERAVLERLGPEVDRLIEERLAKTLNRVLGSSVDDVRSELTVSVRQMVREAVAASVAHALSQPKPE